MNLLLAAVMGMSAAAPTDHVAPDNIKPVLIVLTSHAVKGTTGEPTGFYLGEVTHPLAVFDAAGIPVEFASIQGGEAPVDGLDLNDATNARYWKDPAFREAIRTTPALDQVDAGRYSAVFYAGGHGAVWDFPNSPAVQRLTRQLYEAGGVVAAVCHGPAALVNVTLSDGRYLVADKRVSAFTDDEERAVKLESVVPFLLATTLTQRGAQHQAAPDWTPKVVVDGRLVTGQNPQSATGTAEAVRDLLLSP
ncbi:type 1 glutamine amidotransferase domain-containing protein [Pseudoxanthomonas sp. CF125]|jgi:putative intracellular protease/amidase|uniref:type 1 glutamine amidotransferase domain-containing protein n=1 Tax=Pseudoxanthomonas sp. CF125 TaxID=1855303 RepID=UPI00088A037C|nr:type 1 glutamine amidotransferase domain-containing protein [Pseudoxanthomonas sp. CF125]SDR07905.1 Putative intracellular protease/amidase [Pseudoxanthomonas sp. CF125]